jgi:alpha-tubulin suppressor-like RCC1 family protein
MKAKTLIMGVFMALSVTVFSQYTRNDNQNSNPYARAFQRIGAGEAYCIEVRNGQLWSSGKNNYGQLGIGNNTAQSTAVQVGTDNTWQIFSPGRNHVIAIKSNGTLWGWGANSDGQVGDGSITNRNAPVQIGSDNKWVMVSTGENFSVGLKSDGTLWSWGDNTAGKLGIGNTTDQSTPVQIGSSTDWKYISCGPTQTFAIKANGTLWAWGYNQTGIFGDGTTTNSLSPIQIGTDNKWLKISCKTTHVMALKISGDLYTWGNNFAGQLGNGNTTTQLTPVVIGANYQDIAAGGGFSYAIKGGQLYTWGTNTLGQLGQGNNVNLNTPTLVSNATNIVAIACGYNSGFRLFSNSNLESTGYNANGELGIGSTTNTNSFSFKSSNNQGWLHVELQGYSAYGLKQNGTIWAWGYNFSNVPVQQGTDNDWVSIVGKGSAGSALFYALKADGTLWRFDGTNFYQTSTQAYRSIYSSSASRVYAITINANLWSFTTSNTGTLLSNSGEWVRANGGGISGEFVVALKNDGTVWVNGTNYHGVYGNGTTGTVSGFNQTTISNVIGISSCNFMPYALTSEGKMMAWGNNTYGELHNGTSVSYSTTPVQMTNGTNVIKFDSDNEGYDFAIKGDGTLWHCGSYGGDGPSGSGVLTQHSTAADVVDIAKGWDVSGIIKSQRDVICMTGNNLNGALGNGTTTTNYYFDCSSVVAIKPGKPTAAQASYKNSITEENSLELYPNPSSGLINIISADNLMLLFWI